MKRTHRADLDLVRLEMEALELLSADFFPDFKERFRALREQVQTEISPE